jgi:hypothetical protein
MMKGKPMRTLFLIPVLLAAGCAAYGPWQQQSRDFAQAGRCDDSRSVVSANERDSGAHAAMFGVIYATCDKNQAVADRYFTLAARYGHPAAQQILAERGQPVPVADLRRPQAAAGASGGYSVPAGPITCTTIGIGLSTTDRITRCN